MVSMTGNIFDILCFLCYSKALKCFEKAFALDASNQEAGIFLGDIYLQLGFEVKLTLNCFIALRDGLQIVAKFWLFFWLKF